jgi:hypothetical protein
LAAVFGLDKRRRKALEAALVSAQAADAEENRQRLEQFALDFAEHEQQKQLADRVLAFEPAALLEVIKTVNPFATISELGSGVSFKVRGKRWIAADIDVHSETVIPKNSITLLRDSAVGGSLGYSEGRAPQFPNRTSRAAADSVGIHPEKDLREA